MSRASDLADLGGSADAGGITGKNLIINGSMICSQRGVSETGVTGVKYANAPDRSPPAMAVNDRVIPHKAHLMPKRWLSRQCKGHLSPNRDSPTSSSVNANAPTMIAIHTKSIIALKRLLINRQSSIKLVSPFKG